MSFKHKYINFMKGVEDLTSKKIDWKNHYVNGMKAVENTLPNLEGLVSRSKSSAKKTGVAALSALVLATSPMYVGCGGGGSGDSGSSGNPTQMSNLDNGVYVDENSEVCYNGEDLVISADFTDADGIDKVYGKIGTNDWQEATKSGDNYSLSFPAAHYDNTAGLKTVDILAQDNKGNDYETQVNGYVYMNDQDMYDLDSGSGPGSWLDDKFSNHPDVNGGTVAVKTPSTIIDVDFDNVHTDFYEVLLLSSDDDQTHVSAANSSDQVVVITPVTGSAELENKINNSSYPDY